MQRLKLEKTKAKFRGVWQKGINKIILPDINVGRPWPEAPYFHLQN